VKYNRQLFYPKIKLKLSQSIYHLMKIINHYIIIIWSRH